MKSFFLVFVGGGLGSVVRFSLYRLISSDFPWSTMLVNALGGLCAGFLASWIGARSSDPMWLLLITGFLGGFTTFSAFSLDAVALWQRGSGGAALAYVLASVILAIGGAVVGTWIYALGRG